MVVKLVLDESAVAVSASIVESVRRGKLRGRKIFSPIFLFVGKIDLYSLAPHCRICQREVFSKVSRGFRRLCRSGFSLTIMQKSG